MQVRSAEEPWAVLARTDLFGATPRAHLERIAERLSRRRYRKGETVCRQGEPGTSLCIIEAGRAKVSVTAEDGRETILNVLGPGAVFGELALLDGEPRSGDVIVLEESRLLFLEREPFLGLLRSQPELALQLLAALSRQVRRLSRLLEDARFRDVPARVAQTLLRLADAEGVRTEEGVVIPVHLSQADLAGLAGTTRETLNKVLGTFQDDGLIRLRQGQIVVVEIERLRRTA